MRSRQRRRRPDLGALDPCTKATQLRFWVHGVALLVLQPAAASAAAGASRHCFAALVSLVDAHQSSNPVLLA